MVLLKPVGRTRELDPSEVETIDSLHGDSGLDSLKPSQV